MLHELRSCQIFSNHLYVLVMNLCDMIKQCYVHMEAAITMSLEQSVDPTHFSLYQASSLARIESNLQKWHIWTVPHIPWCWMVHATGRDVACTIPWDTPGLFRARFCSSTASDRVHVYKFVRETLGVSMLTGLAKYNVKGIGIHGSRIYYSWEWGYCWCGAFGYEGLSTTNKICFPRWGHVWQTRTLESTQLMWNEWWKVCYTCWHAVLKKNPICDSIHIIVVWQDVKILAVSNDIPTWNKQPSHPNRTA